METLKQDRTDPTPMLAAFIVSACRAYFAAKLEFERITMFDASSLNADQTKTYLKQMADARDEVIETEQKAREACE